MKAMKMLGRDAGLELVEDRGVSDRQMSPFVGFLKEGLLYGHQQQILAPQPGWVFLDRLVRSR